MVEKVAEGSRWRYFSRRHSNLLEHLCDLRGFDRDKLTPDYSLHLHDPNLLSGMSQARKIVVEAVKEKWPVTVFGDYDADGTPASALLYQLLKHVGLDVEVVLPTRSSGYGLRSEQVTEIGKRSKLLITVDTGITAVAEIALARKLGMKVIVLDHHLPGAELPEANALIDPHLETSEYPFKDLCGCALAFKLAMALREDFSTITDSFCKWQLDLVAISTVADMMPLIDENRALVHYGLIVLRQNRRPGLKALLEIAGVKSEEISATTLGFVIGPRLNASGRLNDNRPALELLIADDPKEAEQLARQVNEANSKRQLIVEEVLAEAEQLLFEQNNPNDLVFTLYKEGWPSGVVGLVAGKICSQYLRPVIVGSLSDGTIKASARSIDAYSIVDALTKGSSLLETYGGHRQAAGLSLNEKNWNKFSTILKKDASELLSDSDLRQQFIADAMLEKKDLDIPVAKQLELLQPFGLGNQRPLVILPQAEISRVRIIGQKNNHLKLTLNSLGQTVDGIGFNMASRFEANPIKGANFLGYLENNIWQGRESLQLRLVDYLPNEATIEAAI